MDSKKDMNIKCLPGWVLIEPIEEEKQTSSGIMLPDSSQDVSMKGRVLAKGKSIKLRRDNEWTFQEGSWTIPVKIGDIVLFKKYSGQTVKQDGKELKLVEFKDLLAVIE